MSVLPVKPQQRIPFQTKNGRLHLLQWCKSLQGEIALRLVSLIFRIIPHKVVQSFLAETQVAESAPGRPQMSYQCGAVPEK